MADLPFTQIPEHWKLERLDHLFRVVKEPAYLNDPPVSAFIDGVVTLRSNRPDAIIKGSGQEIGYKHIEAGDLVISGMNAHLGGLGISDSSGKCTPVYTVMRKTVDLDQRFISYYLWHAAQSGYIKSLVNAVRYNSADFGPETVKRFMVPVPPLDEQRRIANYLDNQLSVVNNLIQTKRDQIDVAREISVTNLFLDLKRHNPIASNYQLPWLDFAVGQKIQFGRMFDVSLGKMLQIEPKSDDDVLLPYLNSASVNDFLSNPEKRMWANPKEFKNCQVLHGDLIVIEGGDVGRSKFYEGEPIIIQNSLHRVRSFSGNSLKYAHAILNAIRHSGYFEIICNVATIRHLTLEKLAELPIPYYAPSVQDDIGKSYEENTKHVSEKLSLLADSITRLGEYKTSLITGAVTGTFDVTTGRSVASWSN
jgi:type I restriction enzyme S subunit